MEYLLLIYQAEPGAEGVSDADEAAMVKAYGEFTGGIIKNGNMRGANRLQPSTTATTVRVRNGKTLSTDGPYAETKEQLAGYYLVDAKDLDEAIAIAAKVPSAAMGVVEVRPVFSMGPPPAGL